ncbi:SoxR reducing system RseC family protein [Allomuricauda sp. SCSIO 65647]|uniref:SoxR reducing system RseC family protein n=1 Tax=Allomuricauda sp. SCSIO 65647 TaxID=2908843 RepID=UPI001F15BFAF|nr:SoxR reducing system RseC family protein [Muricauda sp. SCSIO 65647]UJH66224.1 SoxR reducing system RseC family protein [Muricauda sp. SCSIO 65647]
MDPVQTNSGTLTHSGVVSGKKGRSLIVSLDENLQCESCYAKGTCGIADSGSKQIEVSAPIGSFKLNEPVTVVLQKGLGLKAVFWAYVFPFLLMILTLWAAAFFVQEWVAGVLSLLVLVPYYLVLNTLKDLFKKKFAISVLKIQ